MRWVKLPQDQRAARGVGDLGVELHAVEPPRLVGDGRERRALGGGHDMEAGRDGGDLVAVAHPHRLAIADVAQAGQQRALLGDADIGAAELPLPPAPRPPRPIGRPRSSRRSRCRAPARPCRTGPAAPPGCRAARRSPARPRGSPPWARSPPGRRPPCRRMDLAIDAALAQAPGDQLGHLAAEVDDQHAVVAGLGHGGPIEENRRAVTRAARSPPGYPSAGRGSIV